MTLKLLCWRMVLCFYAAMLAGCNKGPTPAFPSTELIYQTGSLTEVTDARVGFVNADGSGNQFVQSDRPLSKPVWSSNGKTVYALTWGGGAGYTGRLATWEEGQPMRVCQNAFWSSMTQIASVQGSETPRLALVVNAAKQLLLVDLDKCELGQSILDYAKEEGHEVYGASFSADGHSVVFAETPDNRATNPSHRIVSLNLETHFATQIGEGINPATSPDGTLIAFTALDGIYVVNVDGSERRRLIAVNTSAYLLPAHFDDLAPTPRWSPDSQWLTYHRCAKDTVCRRPTDYSIFKAEVATGVEVKIIDSGVYPYWRIGP